MAWLINLIRTFNGLCALFPCSVIQPPPQAYIDTTPYPRAHLIQTTDLHFPTSPRDTYDGGQLFLPNTPTSILSSQNAIATPAQSSVLSRLTIAAQTLFSGIPFVTLMLNNVHLALATRRNNRGNTQDYNSRRRIDEDPPPPAPLVSTKSGTVEGYFVGTMKGRRVVAFEGIPYAEPPLGPKRFQPPHSKLPWAGVLSAKGPGNKCPQLHPIDFFQVTGSEDCLFLNVYTPAVKGQLGVLRPVIFLIHGGSFQYGSSTEYGHAYLLDHEVILVSVNYRLGPLGFLSSGDEESPGNYGLKDQALALRWVHENIGGFGGDKDRVTIVGHSAGAVSAHLHLISNKTTSFFQNGVSLSGTGYGFWPILDRKRAAQLTEGLARAVHCPTSTSQKMLQCLKSVDANTLIEAQLDLYEWIPFHPLIQFAPVIEKVEEGAFLTQTPKEAYALGNVMRKPWIFGQTSQEGHFEIYFLKLLLQSGVVANNLEKYLPLILDYKTERDRNEITMKILRFYVGKQKNVDMNQLISQMYTDRYYGNSLRQALPSHAKILPQGTYAYIFGYKGKYNLGTAFGIQKDDWGVPHTEDMFYYFNSSVFYHGLQRRDVEYQLSQKLTGMLVHFAATGKSMMPKDHSSRKVSDDVVWTPAASMKKHVGENFNFLIIDNKKIEMESDPFDSRFRFWKSLNIPI